MILPNGQLRMFYPGNGLQSAISSDGLNFTVESGSRLQVVGDIAVIYRATGGYRILFPDGPVGSQTLKSATSTDGFNFTMESGSRFTPTTADAGTVQVPHTVRLADGRWRLYYVGDLSNKNNTRTAISSDEGLTFTSETGGSFANEWIDPDAVYLSNGGFRLYVKMKTSGGGSLIGHADASDGLSFPATLTQDLDAQGRLDPFVVRLANGTVRMFFGTSSGIGSATARP